MFVAPDERHGVLGQVEPCLDCQGSGIASCCDAAGSAQPDRPSFTCPRCGAVSYNPNDIRELYCGACHRWADGPVMVCAACGAIQDHNAIRCEKCGKPLVFPKFGDDPYEDGRRGYRDDAYPEHCGKLYRGPAVYCSLECAVADA